MVKRIGPSVGGWIAALVTASASACAPLSAGTASGTMTITATVLPSCTVEAGPLAFGTLAADDPRAAASAALTLDCTPGTPFSVTLDEGAHGGRRMADEAGIGFLAYEIFQDAAATRRWGATTSGAVAGVAPADGKIALNAYGRIVSRTVAAGRYGDVVTVTVQF